ncbi:MAG: mechanosensitive ion channel protein [Pseudomonadales bacterium]|jgi:small conductance mechanosensitive channel|uniref:mechanosensitive ion channel family protein n=1 Tax=unclassified Ketobacter TaxID=2639109 RepID=UPI000C4A53B0|nr:MULTISPECIES: mechanosensitive ion channel domain-containing protein [unclassified Ketobacter]MAQ25302.1 mechanosensitive ion channel protein [Pseudomonadales bacterium]MEC8811257.1 mechanosensitive ion channel domain-containing protein [Pseudomonadota bacterium]TNC83538.1 MAG: mechanosensitive ion channel protein [Alcanivorax sp.]HBO95856.1 mechanosensitive ion channel protein [Gammaproteobacteria bacterium]MBI25980.1 mechanosensitive ion channel protein [Pseudomonadales bacterium]|tara:strand:+ start:21878 stop:22711 length:834 start_codon:yes stop_codon:yes gene_type:complete
MDMENLDLQPLMDKAVEMVMLYAPKLILAIVTLIVGLWLINMMSKGIGFVLEKRSLDVSLQRWLTTILSIVLKACLLISVISMIGVQTTSFIAMLGAAGLAIGLALQGSLTNFAGGVLILFFKPYKVGDYIKTNGEEGFVESIDIFYTFLRTMDSRHVILPNGPLANGNLVNYTMDEVRRVELSVGISYHNRFEDAETALFKMIGEESRVLSDPPPFIGVTGYGDSSIDLTIRAWVKNADYWPVFFDLNKRIKPALDNANISIPFPQRDVHLFQKAT